MTIRTTVEDGCATLTLGHPPLNILTQAVLADVRESLAALAGRDDVRVVVLGAEGKHFSAGADVGEHLPPQYRDLIPGFLATVRAVAEFPQPVIAAVRGRCLGGGFELAMAADLIVAGDGASFGQPEIVLGVVPPVACALLPSLCGPSLAAELVLTGDAIDARRAAAAGLVARVVPDAEVDAAAADFARRMARHSGAALRFTKKSLGLGRAAQRAETLAAAGALYVDELMETADAVEGLQAFLEKRQPQWTHR